MTSKVTSTDGAITGWSCIFVLLQVKTIRNYGEYL
jgi:hypothetical protein